MAYDTYPQDSQFDTNSPDEEFVKKLAKSYKIWSAHRIWLTPINQSINISLITKLKSMFQKIVRDIHGSFWFIKDNKKQKLDGWLSLTGALIDEVGCKTLSDVELNKFTNFQFFGK